MQMVNHFSIPFASIKGRELKKWTRGITQTLYVTIRILLSSFESMLQGGHWEKMERAQKSCEND